MGRFLSGLFGEIDADAIPSIDGEGGMEEHDGKACFFHIGGHDALAIAQGLVFGHGAGKDGEMELDRHFSVLF